MLNEKICKVVTDRMIELIESSHELAWQKCWDCVPSMSPRNLNSQKPYTGINWLITSFINPAHPYHLTFKRLKAMGGTLKKGSKGIPIIFWSMLYLDENGKKLPESRQDEAVKKVPLLRYYTVFNQQDIEGIEFPEVEVKAFTPKQRLAKCESLVKLNQKLRGLKIEEIQQNRAFYSPSQDKVVMPELPQFKSSEHYYGTLFHEMIHWTGHESRLDRFKKTGTSFGSESYSAEELVAEIGSAAIANQLQIQSEEMVTNSAAYLQGWLRQLKADSTFLVQSAFDSEKAVKLITSEE